MLNLNSLQNHPIFFRYPALALTKFKDNLIGCEMGIAYGGGVEQIGKMWKGHGVIHGFDTFEGHPTFLATPETQDAAHAMDPHYVKYGKAALSYEYQRAELDRQGLDNVILHKGLLNPTSLDGIPYLHYALLDLDLLASMRIGWELVRPKMVQGGYLCMHDVTPRGYLVGLWEFYQEVLGSGEYKLVEEASTLAVLERL